MTSAPTDLDLGRAVLAIDRLLRDPRRRDALAAFAALCPVGLRDQIDAATGQARRNLRAVADVIGHRLCERPVDAQPKWVTLGLISALLGWQHDRGRTCMHAPHFLRPVPVVAAAWRPGLVVCTSCTGLLTLPRRSAADRTCDGCGHVCAGVERATPSNPASATLGPFTYLLGVCTTCRWWTP